jgi:hypothetical protein
VKAQQGELDSFMKTVKEWRDNKDKDSDTKPPGSPAPHMFVVIMEKLATMDVGGKNKELLTDQIALWTKETAIPPELSDALVVCRMDRAGMEGMTRFTLSCRTLAIRPTFVAAMGQIGLEHKTGPAPPGYLERDLSEWATSLYESLDM